MDYKEFKFLGSANSWYSEHSEVPKEYLQCLSKGHPNPYIQVSNCLAEYYCPICKIYYTVDSSD